MDLLMQLSPTSAALDRRPTMAAGRREKRPAKGGGGERPPPSRANSTEAADEERGSRRKAGGGGRPLKKRGRTAAAGGGDGGWGGAGSHVGDASAPERVGGGRPPSSMKRSRDRIGGSGDGTAASPPAAVWGEVPGVYFPSLRGDALLPELEERTSGGRILQEEGWDSDMDPQRRRKSEGGRRTGMGTEGYRPHLKRSARRRGGGSSDPPGSRGGNPRAVVSVVPLESEDSISELEYLYTLSEGRSALTPGAESSTCVHIASFKSEGLPLPPTTIDARRPPRTTESSPGGGSEPMPPAPQTLGQSPRKEEAGRSPPRSSATQGVPRKDLTPPRVRTNPVVAVSAPRGDPAGDGLVHMTGAPRRPNWLLRRKWRWKERRKEKKKREEEEAMAATLAAHLEKERKLKGKLSQLRRRVAQTEARRSLHGIRPGDRKADMVDEQLLELMERMNEEVLRVEEENLVLREAYLAHRSGWSDGAAREGGGIPGSPPPLHAAGSPFPDSPSSGRSPHVSWKDEVGLSPMRRPRSAWASTGVGEEETRAARTRRDRRGGGGHARTRVLLRQDDSTIEVTLVDSSIAEEEEEESRCGSSAAVSEEMICTVVESRAEGSRTSALGTVAMSDITASTGTVSSDGVLSAPRGRRGGGRGRPPRPRSWAAPAPAPSFSLFSSLMGREETRGSETFAGGGDPPSVSSSEGSDSGSVTDITGAYSTSLDETSVEPSGPFFHGHDVEESSRALVTFGQRSDSIEMSYDSRY